MRVAAIFFARHSRALPAGLRRHGCRSEHSRSEWPEGRATGVARNPLTLRFESKDAGFPLRARGNGERYLNDARGPL